MHCKVVFFFGDLLSLCFLVRHLFGIDFLLVCRVLEHLLLRDTYTQESLPALQKIRSVIIAFRLFRSHLCVLLAHRNFKSSVHSLHEFHFVPIFSSPCSSPDAMHLNASCYSSGRTLQLSSLKL
jgi:hypothetical protein